jgi:hypothetical protein
MVKHIELNKLVPLKKEHFDRWETLFIENINSLFDDIRENDKVTYDTEEGRKGLNAVEVKVA